MSDQTVEDIGTPELFVLEMPGHWPRVQVLYDIGDRVPDELEPEQAAALADLFASVNAKDGSRMVSVMMTADDVPRPMGVMYINHSVNAGKVMSGLIGIEATPDEIAELRSVGKLQDVETSIVHFDTVGSVSCVTSRRRTSPEARDQLIRAYIIPQPQSMQAVLIVYITAWHEPVLEPWAELCDEITSGFEWIWETD